MKSPFILVLMCAAGLGISSAGFAAEPAGRGDAKAESTKAQLAPAEIKGEVLKVDGDSFVVNDERSKKEVKITIEKDVKAMLDRPVKQGDRIEAYLTPEGLAKKVRFDGAPEQEVNRAGKEPGTVQPPGGLSNETSPTGQTDQQDKGVIKPAEGSNPTLSPGGKGSASGG